MKRCVDILGTKSLIAILYFLLLLVFVGLFSATHNGIVGRMEDAPSTGARTLSEIYKSTLEYRLAELEYVLSFNEKKLRNYETRMKAALRHIERNQEECVNLLSSQESRKVYEEYISDWQAYLNNSRKSIALARKHLNDQANAAVRENSRGSFQTLNKRLDSILKANEKYRKSFSYRAKEWFREYWLTLSFLYICGMAAFLIYIFNRYDKMKKDEDIKSRNIIL